MPELEWSVESVSEPKVVAFVFFLAYDDRAWQPGGISGEEEADW